MREGYFSNNGDFNTTKIHPAILNVLPDGSITVEADSSQMDPTGTSYKVLSLSGINYQWETFFAAANAGNQSIILQNQEVVAESCALNLTAGEFVRGNVSYSRIVNRVFLGGMFETNIPSTDCVLFNVPEVLRPLYNIFFSGKKTFKFFVENLFKCFFSFKK